MMTASGIRAVPHAHPELDTWRNNFRGVRTTHAQTNLALFGAIDDLWRDLDSGALMVVDYKSTSKATEVTLEADWQDGYKRQMEFYQWLLRRQGLTVARRGWFVYCNARRDLAAFDARLEFRIKLIAYDGDDDWVEGTLAAIHETLCSSEPPAVNDECEYCQFAARWAGV